MIDGETVERAIQYGATTLVQTYGRCMTLVALVTREHVDAFVVTKTAGLNRGNGSVVYRTAVGAVKLVESPDLARPDRVLVMAPDNEDGSLCPPMVMVPLNTLKAVLRQMPKPWDLMAPDPTAPAAPQDTVEGFAQRMAKLRGRVAKPPQRVVGLDFGGPHGDLTTMVSGTHRDGVFTILSAVNNKLFAKLKKDSDGHGD